MKHFRKVWNEETNGWLIAHRELNKNYDEMLRLFLEAFPDTCVSRDALKTQCSVIGVSQKRNAEFREHSVFQRTDGARDGGEGRSRDGI